MFPNENYPRVLIAGLKGASGKTFLSLGILSALKEKGIEAVPFKKGPDFIDSSWLTFAAGRQCRNLDPFLMTPQQLINTLAQAARNFPISIIEGNRGLFDGLDHEGGCSSAELARILGAPVLLVVDVTMVTRTAAALVRGCQVLEDDLRVAGVILNRIANSRQETVIRMSIEKYCCLPVVGAVPRLRHNSFPERHMGLIPHHEREGALQALACAREAAANYLDLEAILKIAAEAGPLLGAGVSAGNHCIHRQATVGKGPRIGVVRDEAFWFYYPENLESLKAYGAEILEVSALNDGKIPELDCLYIGGGFPETLAERLSSNISFRMSLWDEIEKGLPVYAECGGLMYLGEEIVSGERRFPMVGALPVSFELEKRPQGHGYTILRVEGPNPFFSVGEVIKGHEFHYSRALVKENAKATFVLRTERGCGISAGMDGIRHRNALATYTHIHAGGAPNWGLGIVRAATEFRAMKESRIGKR